MSETETVSYPPSVLPQLSVICDLDALLFLEQIVAIDSQTQNIEGVNLVQNHLAQYLSSLGFVPQFIPNTIERSGNLLIAEKKGTSTETITFVGHADTVFSPGNGFEFKINQGLNEVHGPGIGDDKGGVSMALSALENFLSTHKSHYYTLLFVSSPNEEMGSIGFHQIFKEIGEKSKIIFGLEPALYNGALISSRNGNRWYNIEILGRSAHSGRFGEPFVNAAHHAAEFISRGHKPTNISRKIKVNVGAISGGVDKYNVVCDKVDIKLDIRFPCYESRDFLHKALHEYLNDASVECFYTQEQCTVNFQIVDDCPPLALREKTHPIISMYLQEIDAIEEKNCGHEHSGGAADINYFYRPGLIYLDGVGPITSGMHTRHEVMKLDSFFTRRLALVNMLARLNENEEGVLCKI